MENVTFLSRLSICYIFLLFFAQKTNKYDGKIRDTDILSCILSGSLFGEKTAGKGKGKGEGGGGGAARAGGQTAGGRFSALL